MPWPPRMNDCKVWQVEPVVNSGKRVLDGYRFRPRALVEIRRNAHTVVQGKPNHFRTIEEAFELLRRRTMLGSICVAGRIFTSRILNLPRPKGRGF